jgi:CspA family cold shock protein
MDMPEGDGMKFGVVKSFDRRLGVGLISPEDGGADVGVHVSAVERAGLSTLEVGDRLSYAVMKSGARGAVFAMKLRLC